MFLFLLLIPILVCLLTLFIKKARLLGVVNSFAYLALLIISFLLFYGVSIKHRVISAFNFFYIDALSAFFILVTAVVSFAAALYSISYIDNDVKQGVVSGRKVGTYYLLFNLFCGSMFFVAIVNNLGMLWAAIEMTTLVSAFLVGFYKTKASVEAAWKYLIICSVGIILALLGTILFSYSLSIHGALRSLNWTEIYSVAGQLDQRLFKVAFIFILVGYGTKAGLAPMHTWLPDAHSQAVSPISALLSGVLLKTSIYAILRFTALINKNLGSVSYSGNMLLLFGIISLILSAGFILLQKDIKRLLAYSSIEHVGIIAIGLGIGGNLGLAGALLHIFNHAVTKSLMFFGAGNIVGKYKTHNAGLIRGVIGSMPFTGVAVLIGIFALAGFPPFSIFLSEILIVIAAFLKGSYMVAGLFLLLVALIFGALIYRFGRMLFGNIPKGMPVSGEPLGMKLAFFFLLIFICGLGIVIPWFAREGILSALEVLRGV